MSIADLGRSLFEALRKITGQPSVDREAVKELCNDLVRALLKADVNLKLVLDLAKRVEHRALNEDLPVGFTRREHIIKIVYEEVVKLLGGEKPFIPMPKPGRLNVIMLVGIQGSGKTTTAAKLARFYMQRGFRVGLICADTYRPGAYHQLMQLARDVGVSFYGEIDSKDPIKIVENGIREFRERNLDLVIVDTAGRHKDESMLMEEARLLYERIKPDFVGLVLDGTIGQQAAVQAEAFKKVCDVGFVIVTKLDGSSKGGGALSAVAATGAPIAFIGLGEKIEDLEGFDPARFVARLLGLGDIRGLIEKAREAELEVSRRRASVMLYGKFTLKDFYEQLEASRKLGPLSKLLSLRPGLAYRIPDEELEEMERNLDKWRAILQSMRREEMEDPKIINTSRIRRIARGAGVRESDVKELLKRYEDARRILKAMRGRRLPIHKLRDLGS
jgi:signal recognition particle subunit SRP54